MNMNSPMERTGDTPADATSGSGREDSGLGEVMPFSPKQLVLIDCLITSCAATTRDPTDAAGASGTTMMTTGKYSLV